MPAAERAVTAALGPGTGTTLNPAARAFLTTVAPGYRRRARVRDQGNGLASGELFDYRIGGAPFVMPVHRHQISLQAMVREQARRHARVLRRYGVGMSERMKGARADILEVPNRRGHHI